MSERGIFMKFSVNHPIIFVIVGILIALVLAQSIYFLIRAVKKKNFNQNENTSSSGYKDIANLVGEDICLAKLIE